MTTGATISTLTNILKEKYEGPIRDLLNTKKILMRMVRRGPKRDVEGKTIVIPMWTGRHHGYGSRAEDGDLPTAGSVGYRQANPTMRYHYLVVKITGPGIEAGKTDKGAFLRALNAELKGGLEGFLNDQNRQMFGDSSGILTKCLAGGPSTTVNLDTADSWGVQYPEVGQSIDIEEFADGTNLAADRTISSINKTAGTMVISGAAVTTTTAHAVYVAGNRNLENMGLLGMIYDGDPGDLQTSGVGSLQALAVATEPNWAAYVDDNGGVLRDVSISLLQDQIIEIDLASGLGDEIGLIMCHHKTWKPYGLLLTPDRRYSHNATKLEGGYRYLEFDGVPIMYDRHCQHNRMYFLNRNHLAIYEQTPIEWSAREGHILKWVTGKDGWQAFLHWYAQFVCTRRNAFGVLQDLKES